MQLVTQGLVIAHNFFKLHKFPAVESCFPFTTLAFRRFVGPTICWGWLKWMMQRTKHWRVQRKHITESKFTAVKKVEQRTAVEHIFSNSLLFLNFAVIIRATKVNKVKIFLPFLKFTKRPNTKFHAHTMRVSQVIKLKKSQNLLLGQNLSLDQTFFAAQFFLLNIDILLKPQQQILICFCKFSCNSVIIVGLLRFLT